MICFVGEAKGVGASVGVILGVGVTVGVGEETALISGPLSGIMIQSPTATPEPIAIKPRIAATSIQSALDVFFRTGWGGMTSRTL
jgi:hypothetical protein